MEATSASLTLPKLRELYLVHAERHYRRRSGEPTREHLNIRSALDRFVEFAPPATKADASKINRHQVRAWVDQLAAEGLSRSYVNQCLDRLRRCVRWAADLEYVPFAVTEDLRRVKPLVAFRSTAKEPAAPTPPALDAIELIVPHLPKLARAVVQLMLLTGARPSEILELKNSEVIQDDEGARMEPLQHKGAHRGIRRVIPLSPKALAIIQRHWRPFCPDDHVFESPASRAGHYSIGCFRAAVSRACKKAGVPKFTPYAMRHAVARHVRRTRGLDAAQALLGHTNASTTEIYAPLTAGDPRTLEAARRATEVL